MLRADFLDKLKHLAAAVHATHANRSQGALWVPELGGAYNSGRPRVTDSFVSGFWYLDALGVLALAGTQVVCRQTLLGGSYALLELGAGPRASGAPEAAGGGGPRPRRLNSDFYGAALWRKLMGPRVLAVHLRADDEAEAVGREAQGAKERAAARAEAKAVAKAAVSLRLYASCTGTAAGLPAGAMTLLALNLRSAPRAPALPAPPRRPHRGDASPFRRAAQASPSPSPSPRCSRTMRQPSPTSPPLAAALRCPPKPRPRRRRRAAARGRSVPCAALSPVRRPRQSAPPPPF